MVNACGSNVLNAIDVTLQHIDAEKELARASPEVMPEVFLDLTARQKSIDRRYSEENPTVNIVIRCLAAAYHHSAPWHRRQ